MTTVLGLDLSLTSTGCASVDADDDVEQDTWLIRPRGTGIARLQAIRDTILDHLDSIPADLVVIEGYSFGSRTAHAHALGELGGVVRVALTEYGVRWVDLPPSTVKKFATGKGNADKGAVLAAAIRRLGYSGSSNDEADALFLAHAGHVLLGRPLVDLPQAHLAALAAHTINPIDPVENL